MKRYLAAITPLLLCGFVLFASRLFDHLGCAYAGKSVMECNITGLDVTGFVGVTLFYKPLFLFVAWFVSIPWLSYLALSDIEKAWAARTKKSVTSKRSKKA